MSCFTPGQYRMVTKGLQSFRDRVALANMLAAMAETPKVQRFPDAPIAQKLLDIDRITAPTSNKDKVIYDVLQEIQASTLCRELVKTAHEWSPHEPNLEALDRQFLRIKTVEPQQESELEALLSITREQFLNPLTFAQRFGPIRYRVCRVEIKAKDADTLKPDATGFLVGPDVVLTNHHVIRPILRGTVDADRFVFGFDRVDWEDGTETSGPTYGLNTPSRQEGWLLAMDERLDYALIRLETQAGALPILTSTTDPTAAERGWLSLSKQGSEELAEEAPLLIFQHPDGLPLRLDIRMVGALSPTRVTYTTNTMPGSSGSPCFDRELRLSALHRGKAGALNEGIPITAILADLEQKNLQGNVTIE